MDAPCFNVIAEYPKSRTGSLAVPRGRVANLYFMICDSSGNASKSGKLSIASP